MNRTMFFEDGYSVFVTEPRSPAPYDGMAKVAALSCRETGVSSAAAIRGLLHQKGRDRVAALVFHTGRLVGFGIVRRVFEMPYARLDVAAVHHQHAEMGSAALTAGLSTWLRDRSMQPWRTSQVNRIINVVQLPGEPSLHDTMAILGWRRCGEFTHQAYGRLQEYYLCGAYGLESKDLFAAMRRYILERSRS